MFDQSFLIIFPIVLTPSASISNNPLPFLGSSWFCSSFLGSSFFWSSFCYSPFFGESSVIVTVVVDEENDSVLDSFLLFGLNSTVLVTVFVGFLGGHNYPPINEYPSGTSEPYLYLVHPSSFSLFRIINCLSKF